jgi:heme-degrading monooxygenase HmoA
MIARVWCGVVAAADADAYADYMLETGVPGYASTPGNQGVYMLRRTTDAGCEFVMLSLWESMDDVRAFAGADTDQAVFYPEDDRFLIDRDLIARHYEVVAHPEDIAGGTHHQGDRSGGTT